MIARANDLRRVRTQAGEWLLRMSEGPLSDQEMAELEQWRAADPQHAFVFAGMAERFEGMSSLERLRPLAEPAWRQPASLRRGRSYGPIAIGGMAAAAALVLAFVYTPALLDPPHAQYATEIAELRVVTLSDGSRVTVGADSTVEERFSDTERRVRLTGGEAFFEVTHNTARPFFVEAGPATVRVVGTKFDVRRRASRVSVAVLEGEVRVGADRAVNGPDIRVLRAGQSVDVIGATALLAPPASVQEIALVRGEAPGDWRSGRLTYDGVRLGDVAADINRYYGPGFSISSDVADIEVTASFKATEIEGFLATLDLALPVEVSRAADGAFAATGRSNE